MWQDQKVIFELRPNAGRGASHTGAAGSVLQGGGKAGAVVPAHTLDVLLQRSCQLGWKGTSVRRRRWHLGSQGRLAGPLGHYKTSEALSGEMAYCFSQGNKLINLH